MEEEKYLSVMDLAAQVGVPRTTINDWLSKYSQFITSIQQGRRRVYLQNTVVILKEIGSLRSSGLSFTEIEKRLAMTHPIQAVPAMEELPLQEKEEAEKKEEKVSSGQENISSGNTENSLQIVPASKDDFAHLVESMAILSGKLLEEEKKRSRNVRLATGAFFLIFLAFATIGAMLHIHFQRLEKENVHLKELNTKTNERLSVTEKNAISLQGENSAFKVNIRQLEKELIQQRKDFAKTIDTVITKKEAAIAKERERFASERLSYLKKLEEADKKIRETRKREMDAQKKAMEAQKREMDAHKKVVDAQKKAMEAQKKVMEAQKREMDAKKTLEEKNKKEIPGKNSLTLPVEKKDGKIKEAGKDNGEKK